MSRLVANASDWTGRTWSWRWFASNRRAVVVKLTGMRQGERAQSYGIEWGAYDINFDWEAWALHLGSKIVYFWRKSAMR